jgi:hypothetical protein
MAISANSLQVLDNIFLTGWITTSASGNNVIYVHRFFSAAFTGDKFITSVTKMVKVYFYMWLHLGLV